MAMKKFRPNPDWMTIEESCELLGISRPTFDKRRKEFHLKKRSWQGRLWFLRRQLTDRILLQAPQSVSPLVDLIEASCSRVSHIKRKGNMYDFRSLHSIDPFGVICLLCSLISEKDKSSVIIDDSNVVRLLNSIGFFSELMQKRNDLISVVRPPYTGSWIDPSIMQQLVSVVYKGGERLAVAELQKSLTTQGFTTELGNYVGWVIGELADNALTHGKANCYTIVQRVDKETRRIAIGLGDAGLGIPTTLKLNPKYAALSNREALLTTFRPYVSGWGDEYKRGKGLTDIIKILVGNRGYMRVESDTLALRMDFRDGVNIDFVIPMTRCQGTRYLIVLEDRSFCEISRSEADQYLETAMHRIFNNQKKLI
ncbi:MAG: hypothetical protein HY843_02570 [Bdellovibrio sp.]|nr:hypothetical protein [Bdellovibrio sp.]